jgi:hypothetical protein
VDTFRRVRRPNDVLTTKSCHCEPILRQAGMTHARCTGQVQGSAGNVCQPPQRVHEAITPESAPTKQLDAGVATAFVGATSNNAHKLILFSQKRTAWQAGPVSGAIWSPPDGASAARSIPKYNRRRDTSGRIVTKEVPQ